MTALKQHIAHRISTFNVQHHLTFSHRPKRAAAMDTGRTVVVAA